MPKMDEKPTERLAVLLDDLDRIDPMLLVRTTHGRLDPTNPVRLAPKTVIVPFSCPLREAALAADIIQSEFRREGERPAAFYLFSPSGNEWAVLPTSTTFTTVVEGKAVPNPRLFPSTVPRIKAAPLPVDRVEF